MVCLVEIDGDMTPSNAKKENKKAIAVLHKKLQNAQVVDDTVLLRDSEMMRLIINQSKGPASTTCSLAAARNEISATWQRWVCEDMIVGS
jgi:hypothetical protein